MRRVQAVLLVSMCLMLAAIGWAEAAVYVHVDGEGTAHYTDAPTKPYFRRLPAFGLPQGVNLTHGQYAELINAVAAEQGVDPGLIKAIIRTESNFDQHAVSRKGAQGLMQLMPGTAGRYAVSNAFDPAENIRGGVQYLRYLQDLFPGQLPLAIAAYNAGENAVLRHNGIPPYVETRQYVARVLRDYGRPDAAPDAVVLRRRGPARTDVAQRVASTPSVFRQMGPDGTPMYTNMPPLVRPQ
jgi:soluble lytic murein transglycosylase-like protein